MRESQRVQQKTVKKSKNPLEIIDKIIRDQIKKIFEMVKDGEEE